MKMPNSIFVFVLLTIYHINLHAQAPGYLGKRTTLEVSGEFQLAVFKPNKNGSSLEGSTEFEENSISFNRTLTINSNFAITRNNAIGIKYHRAATGVIFDTYTENRDWYTTFTEIGMQRFGLTYSMFKLNKASLSPLGSSFYVTLGGVLLNSKGMRTRDYRMEITPLSELYPNLKLNVSAIDFGIGWNKRWLVLENVFFKTGVHINGMISPKRLFYFYGNNSYNHPDYETDSIQADYETAILNRVLLHNLFNFEIGVGAILF